jgi:hypothetical protein
MAAREDRGPAVERVDDVTGPVHEGGRGDVTSLGPRCMTRISSTATIRNWDSRIVPHGLYFGNAKGIRTMTSTVYLQLETENCDARYKYCH